MRRTRGFTLTELVVSIVIMGILASIGAATYASFGGKIKDSKAKEALIAVGEQERQHFSTRGTFASDLTSMQALESSYTYTYGPSTGPGIVSVSQTVTTVVGLAALSEGGQCYALSVSDPSDSSTQDRKISFTPSAAEPCTGDTALSGAGAAW